MHDEWCARRWRCSTNSMTAGTLTNDDNYAWRGGTTGTTSILSYYSVLPAQLLTHDRSLKACCVNRIPPWLARESRQAVTPTFHETRGFIGAVLHMWARAAVALHAFRHLYGGCSAHWVTTQGGIDISATVLPLDIVINTSVQY